MNTHRRIIFMLILCALLVLYNLHKALADTPRDIPVPEQFCMGEKLMPASSLSLDPEDNYQLQLAAAFTAYLDKEGVDSRVVKSIYSASLRSGVDFKLLMLKAIMESDLGRFTAAANSTARGVFQYIEPTWLVLIRRYGAQAGYERYAQAVGMTKGTGIPYIREQHRHLQDEILALRYDPDAAALIKAYQVREETDLIAEMKRGLPVSATDHYIVHMLGVPLAREFYDLKYKNSVIAVAGLNRPAMREAARLNPVFFYERGRALTAKESFRKFEKRVAHEFRKMNAIAAAYESQDPCVNHEDTAPTPRMVKKIDANAFDLAAFAPGLASSFPVAAR